MRYLSIKNLQKYQHYRDRRPPWIKLHAAIFDDYAFQCLQDASKAHLMLLWLLASQVDNRIPYDLDFICRKLGTTSPVDMEELILQGFIEVSQDDGKTLAPRKQMPIAETETEAEAYKKETETKPSSTKKGRGKPAPYMGRVIETWQLTYPGSQPPPGTANALRPLFARMGEDAAVEELKSYLATTPTTYLNLSKFASTAGTGANPTQTRPNGRLSPSERIDATMAEATLKGQPAWMTAKIPC